MVVGPVYALLFVSASVPAPDLMMPKPPLIAPLTLSVPPLTTLIVGVVLSAIGRMIVCVPVALSEILPLSVMELPSRVNAPAPPANVNPLYACPAVRSLTVLRLFVPAKTRLSFTTGTLLAQLPARLQLPFAARPAHVTLAACEKWVNPAT